MENQSSTRGRTGFFGQKRNIYLLAVGVAVLVIILFAGIFFYLSDAFRSEPKVAVHADNRYTETLRVVTDRDYEPFSYVDGDGKYAGMDVELINEIANRLQMNLEFELLPWDDAIARFQNGQADTILNMETDLIADNDGMIATIPTVEKQYVVYGREKITSVAELYGKRVASLHRLPQLGLKREITYLDSYAEIFEALKNGEYDFAVCPIQVGNVFVQRMGISGVQPSYAVNHVYGAIVLSSENAALVDRIDAVLSEMQREGRLDELDSKWISHRYLSLSLTGVLEQYPALTGSFLTVLLLIIFLFTALMLQHRNVMEKEGYTRQLQENLEQTNRLNAELVEARDRAEASSQAKTIFLSNMSHDIRTPMNAIIGYTNLAKRDGTGEPEMREYLEKIGSSSQHLLALINDVLEMSRIESGKMELELTETDLQKTLNEIRDMFATQMQSKQIRYTVDASDVKGRLVLCDKNRLKDGIKRRFFILSARSCCR